ncbi:GNAT family N-acetyltransferase [Oscillatoria salina]|uniref:GNAT family N-acetyltransferase n=1 Tax=Oscillatoria salina TaxID=331517 RepID=UPI0013BC0276|nr:GNAT family N-acetyltransferase [Oscillatoria salina]MBZ8181480.1 GNAT family N-acetyltransferase [Oscillatoria salina IIICB1]NET87495.1 GNAT family N-acetyltransferase [Kamptonema sp. SIO1D9]
MSFTKKNIVLEQEYKKLGLKVFLSPLENKQIDYLIRLAQDPNLVDLMGINLAIQPGDIEGFIQTISAYSFPYSRKSKPLIYGVYFNVENLPIGYGVLKGFNQDLLTAEVGIAILDNTYRNRGYGRLVLNRLVAYAFQELGMQKIGAAILSSNMKSINMCKKSGFIVQKNELWKMPNGELVSMVLLELQAEDFIVLSA